MSTGSTFARHRWFALAAAFLLVNAWGVLKLTAPARFMGRYVVATFEPGPDATVAPRGRVAWEFSEAMVGADALGPVTNGAPATFTPDVAGRFAWERPHRLVFAPENGWRACTRYAAVLAPRLRSAA